MAAIYKEPGILARAWRALTKPTMKSKIMRSVLVGAPTAAIAKLLGAGWGTSLGVGAVAGTAAWHAPRLDVNYLVQTSAMNNGVSQDVLDTLYFAGDDAWHEMPTAQQYIDERQRKANRGISWRMDERLKHDKKYRKSDIDAAYIRTLVQNTRARYRHDAGQDLGSEYARLKKSPYAADRIEAALIDGLQGGLAYMPDPDGIPYHMGSYPVLLTLYGNYKNDADMRSKSK